MNCVFSKNAMRKKRWKSHKKYFGIPSLYKINYLENFIQRNKLCKRMLGKLIYKIIRRENHGIY